MALNSVDPMRPYRIAIRAEGNMINAYWTRTGTMEGAELVACISRDVCDSSNALFEAFHALIEATSVELVRLRLGAHLRIMDIETTAAPERELAGRD